MRLDICCGGDHSEVVAQPLHERSGDGDGAFEGVHRGLIADLVADGGEQSVLAHDLVGACVQQHEVACAIGVLRLTGRQARLTERGGLLVAQDAGDGNTAERTALADIAVHLGGAADLREHGHRDAHVRTDALVPGQGVEIHQQRARGIGGIGVVQTAVDTARHVPQDPGVHVAEAQLAGVGLLLRALDVVEDPLDLGAREVGRERQAGLRGVLGGVAPAELGDDAVGASVLPDDGVVDGLAGGTLPHQCGLALVGDAHGRDVRRGEVGRGECAGGDAADVVPDLHSVVLDPPGLREDLLVLALIGGDDGALVIEDHAPSRGGALIDRCDVTGFGHEWFPWVVEWTIMRTSRADGWALARRRRRDRPAGTDPPGCRTAGRRWGRR